MSSTQAWSPIEVLGLTRPKTQQNLCYALMSGGSLCTQPINKSKISQRNHCLYDLGRIPPEHISQQTLSNVLNDLADNGSCRYHTKSRTMYETKQRWKRRVERAFPQLGHAIKCLKPTRRAREEQVHPDANIVGTGRKRPRPDSTVEEPTDRKKFRPSPLQPVSRVPQTAPILPAVPRGAHPRTLGRTRTVWQNPISSSSEPVTAAEMHAKADEMIKNQKREQEAQKKEVQQAKKQQRNKLLEKLRKLEPGKVDLSGVHHEYFAMHKVNYDPAIATSGEIFEKRYLEYSRRAVADAFSEDEKRHFLHEDERRRRIAREEEEARRVAKAREAARLEEEYRQMQEEAKRKQEAARRIALYGPEVERRPIREGEECAICQDAMDMNGPKPLEWCSHGCGNSFHEECLGEWKNSSRDNDQAVRCPFCRKKMP
ncbi:hypothetical protein BDV96DRAFT_690795 [Lophiotrema nucula]|uniref:RING-type domain-containing protein n=1 Tax=Lophiotrema nucula TaxID=690887 RepID=A0A6A5YUZ7_9PLEO|nr:hypothetical protein BDV96DRAFT_690795 [Lophiotrema nucula]